MSTVSHISQNQPRNPKSIARSGKEVSRTKWLHELHKERELSATKVETLEGAAQAGHYDLAELVSRLEPVQILDEEIHTAGLVLRVEGNPGVISWTDDDAESASEQGELVVRIESAFDKRGNHFDQLIQRIIIDGLHHYAAAQRKGEPNLSLGTA